MSDYSSSPPTRREVERWLEMGKKYDPRTGDRIRRKTDEYQLLKAAMTSGEYAGETVTEKSVTTIDLDDPFGEKKAAEEEAERKRLADRSPYFRGGRRVIFDDYTMVVLRSARERKICLISLEEIEDRARFEFPYQFDWLTGQLLLDDAGRPVVDPYGPLCFHVYELAFHLYMNRYKQLWSDPMPGQEWGGHYGDAVAIGPEFRMRGRDLSFPEWNPYRLPVEGVYVLPDTDTSVPTCPPELTTEMLKEIDEKVTALGTMAYRAKFRVNYHSLVKMKELYDRAISPASDGDESIQRAAVDALRQLR